MKTCRMILLALLMMVLVGGFAIAEPAALYAVEGEELVLFEQNNVKVYLTGTTETFPEDSFRLNLVIENETDKSIHVYYNGVVNGWSLNGDYGATMSQIYPHSKGKGQIWFTFYEFDIREYADLEEMRLTFSIEDVATYEYMFTVDVGTIYFNADEVVAAEETIAEEPVQSDSIIDVQGVFVGNLSEQLSEDTADLADFQGYSDCIVVFDYVNDDENRRLPELKNGYTSDEVTLSIGGKNTYNAYVPQYKECDYIDAVTRYAGYANPIGYGNLLGGADPVRMYALFFINPNDIASGAEMVITVGDQTGVCSADIVQSISIPDEIMQAEADYETAQQVAAFKWRMDKAFNDAVFVVNAKGGFGSDYNGMSKAMFNIFNEDVSWGISMIDMPHGGFSNIDGIYFEKVLSNATKPLDLSVIKAAYPEVAPLIQFYANTTTELGAAITNSKTTTNSINELLSDNLNAYFDLCEFFGLQNLAEYQADNGISSKLTKFIKYWESNNFRKHVVITFSDKDTVQKVQQALNDAGYNCGTPDGVAGKKTAAAIEQYQESKGLQKTGTITLELLVAMEIEITG